MRKIKEFLTLQNILSSVSFLCLLFGLAGLTGTCEQEVTDPDGVVLAILLITVGMICAVWSMYESGYLNRSNHTFHGGSRNEK